MITIKGWSLPLQGQETAVALGCFDGLHIGHRAVIGRAVAQQSRGLAPCVFTFTMQRPVPGVPKGRQQLQSLPRKLAELEALGVQLVATPDFSAFCHLSPEAFVTEILAGGFRARVVCCGFNFRFGKGAAGDVALLRQLCEPLGIGVEVLPPAMVDGQVVSSTRIRELVAAGDMPAVERLLGHRFTVDFPVERGRQLARTLDFPTINQRFPPEFVVPRHGVYASVALVDGVYHPAVTNVGVKPTVTDENLPLAETFITGVERELYGETVDVALLRFLRPERRFESIAALKAQMAQDVHKATGLTVGQG